MLKLRFFNVADGDAALVEYGAYRMLVDAGRKTLEPCPGSARAIWKRWALTGWTRW